MQIIRDIATLHRAVDALKQGRKSVALVPTMGALHEGHLSLVRMARRVADHVVFLDGGVVVESGPPRAIFQTPERERTKRFIASLNTAVSYEI